MATPGIPDRGEPWQRGLWIGLSAYRLIAFGWMVVLAAISDAFEAKAAGWAAIVVTGVWTAWFIVRRGWELPWARWADLALALGLLLLSGVVMRERTVVGGFPFFATGYPASAAMTIGATGGVGHGLFAGVLLSVALVLSRPINGVPLTLLTNDQVAGLANGVVYFFAAGLAAGLVSRVLTRSAAELREAEEETVRQRERAARLAERESLGRQIHDSVLQALAMVHKRGRELATRGSVAPEDVRQLVELAHEQERALRALIQRESEEAPPGTVPLQTVLRAAAYGVSGVPVTVTTVDPVWLPSNWVEELSAAVRQALENVARHADASQAAVFGEHDDPQIVVAIRDDGVGFDFDEARLASEGKVGMLKSMKGRIEDLGGTMRVISAPGRGTEVEFRLPMKTEVSG